MRLPRWAGTTAFRVTLLHLALTLAGTAILSGIAWWAATGFARRQLVTDIERDVGVLLQADALGGLPSVAVAVEARVAARGEGGQYYLLSAPDGARIAGNLAEAPHRHGWAQLALEGPEGRITTLLAVGVVMPHGGFLVVARDLAPVRALESRLLDAAGWVGGGALVLGLIGGAVIG
ncbi:MAG TPA: hypothetical protein VE684_19500, partial [Crenalkalicoccus sp.]|nr:hypothetical protein [Crenalkalicoccus sp.]